MKRSLEANLAADVRAQDDARTGGGGELDVRRELSAMLSKFATFQKRVFLAEEKRNETGELPSKS